MSTPKLPDTCPEKVRRGVDYPRWEACGRKVVRKGLCGVHARAAENRERDYKRNEERRREADDAARAAEELSTMLDTPFGVQSHWRGDGWYVALAVDDAQQLLARLQGGQPLKGGES